MIVVNYWREKDCELHEFNLHLAGMVNETLNLFMDVDLINECIFNENYSFKEEVLYEVYLTRATISADPIPEPAFAVFQIIQKKQNKDTGEWETPLVRM